MAEKEGHLGASSASLSWQALTPASESIEENGMTEILLKITIPSVLASILHAVFQERITDYITKHLLYS